MTFQEAKDQIAREKDYHTWDLLCYTCQNLPELRGRYEKLAAYLYATEAIKADRERIVINCLFHAEGYTCLDETAFDNLPISQSPCHDLLSNNVFV